MQEIKDYVSQINKLLPIGTSLSYTEYEKRAATFLDAMSKLIDQKHLLSEDKIKLLSIQSVTYAQELSKVTGKTITENKITVEANPVYINAREALEGIDNDINYIKAHLELYTNAHIFFRNLAKGDNI